MKLRVLIMAEAANPELASVPLVGWSMTRAIAEVADVHLVTQVRNRDAILRAGWKVGDQFTAIDSEAVASPLFRLRRLLGGRGNRGWTIGTAMNAFGNYYYESVVWKRLGGRIREHEFDVVHRVTPLSPTIPSPIASKVRCSGVPFVLGPLNGGLPWPRQFESARRAEFEWLSYLRSLYRLLPGFGQTRQSAAAILVGSRATFSQMPSRYRGKCVHLPENAVDPSRFSMERTPSQGGPLRLVFVGRLVPYKGADMAIRAALPLLRRDVATLVVVGDGPMRRDLEDLVSEEDVAGRVRFTGWVDHRAVGDALAEADLLVFPSIREFGGGVVLEAMAMGVVPVVVDYGGPAELVTPDTGVAVPLGDRPSIQWRITNALEELARDRRRLRAMSKSAVERVEAAFTWAAKAEAVLRVYRRVLENRERSPLSCPPRPRVMAPVARRTG